MENLGKLNLIGLNFIIIILMYYPLKIGLEIHPILFFTYFCYSMTRIGHLVYHNYKILNAHPAKLRRNYGTQLTKILKHLFLYYELKYLVEVMWALYNPEKEKEVFEVEFHKKELKIIRKALDILELKNFTNKKNDNNEKKKKRNRGNTSATRSRNAFKNRRIKR